MNRYDSLRKQKTSRMAAASVLAVCVLLSASMLFSRLMGFSPEDTRHYIPLDKSRGSTSVMVGHRTEDGSVTFESTGYHPANHRMLTANPGFRVTDENTVWKGQTDIEIFRVTYENGNGEVTVHSTSGDKLLAPGTENTYAFALENTGNVTLKYSMDMEAYFTTGEYIIPVNAQVKDHLGNYLAGSPEGMADVMELNQVSQEGNIAAGHILPFELTWEWPFEEDDVYDTMLGNQAVEEDICLTIVINTMASYTPGPGGGIPQTGDTSQIALMTGLMLASLAGMMLLLLGGRRKQEEQDA